SVAPVSAPDRSPATSLAPVSASIASRPPVDEEALVRRTLQQYKRAYDGLDARSASAVYPALNEGALARAFDGLAAQSLTFDACDVRLSNGSAMASWRGSARYVAKGGRG